MAVRTWSAAALPRLDESRLDELSSWYAALWALMTPASSTGCLCSLWIPRYENM